MYPVCWSSIIWKFNFYQKRRWALLVSNKLCICYKKMDFIRNSMDVYLWQTLSNNPKGVSPVKEKLKALEMPRFTTFTNTSTAITFPLLRRQSFTRKFLENSWSQEFFRIHRRKPAMESLLYKLSDYVCNLTKKGMHRRCSSETFFKTTFS